MSKTKKGISPLIAAVLLIAFTMGIAAILTTWITTFTNDQKDKTQVFEDKIECAYMDIRADPDFARLNTTNYLFQDYITNPSTVDVEIIEFQAWVNGIPEKPKKMINNTNIKIIKESGRDITLNLSNILSSGGELTQVKFKTRCEAVYTTLWKPVSGWNYLPNADAITAIDGAA